MLLIVAIRSRQPATVTRSTSTPVRLCAATSSQHRPAPAYVPASCTGKRFRHSRRDVDFAAEPTRQISHIHVPCRTPSGTPPRLRPLLGPVEAHRPPDWRPSTCSHPRDLSTQSFHHRAGAERANSINPQPAILRYQAHWSCAAHPAPAEHRPRQPRRTDQWCQAHVEAAPLIAMFRGVSDTIHQLEGGHHRGDQFPPATATFLRHRQARRKAGSHRDARRHPVASGFSVSNACLPAVRLAARCRQGMQCQPRAPRMRLRPPAPTRCA